MRFPTRQRPLPTGLELDSSQIRAVRVDPDDHRRIATEASAEVPRNVLRGGEVVDPEALAAVLGGLFDAHPELSRDVRVGLANQKMVVRTLDLPPIDDPGQLASAVRFHAADELPMPAEVAVIDHVPIGRVQTPDGERQRVVLVAARRDMVELVLAALRGAKLRPVGIDLAGFAMVRALAPADEVPTVYVSAEALTNVAIATGPLCRFTRVVGFGLSSVADELSSRHETPWREVVQLMLTVGLDGAEPEGLDGRLVADVRRSLNELVRTLAADVRSTLQFHQMDGHPPVARGVLTGTVVAVPGFLAAFEQELGVPVEPGQLPTTAGTTSSTGAVSAGLAVEEIAA